MRTAIFLAIIITASSTIARSQTLQDQAICARQAKVAFRDWNNSGSVPGLKILSDNYQSHYNTKIKKCLIFITYMSSMKGKLSEYYVLLDAFERREYARYLNSVAAPPYCELTPTLDQTILCKSETKFDAFVAKYMEQ